MNGEPEWLRPQLMTDEQATASTSPDRFDFGMNELPTISTKSHEINDIQAILQKLKELEALTDGNVPATLVLNADGSGHVELDGEWGLDEDSFASPDEIERVLEHNRQALIAWLSEHDEF